MKEVSSPTEITDTEDDSVPSIIRVVVAYPWKIEDEHKVVPARLDSRWKTIKAYAISAGESVKTSVTRRAPAPVRFIFEVSRLRGTHGRMLLDNLRKRISEADIVIADIGSRDGEEFNSNVLLETGMAIGRDAQALRDIFILKPAKLSIPSDLNGFLFTDYEVTNSEGVIKVIDDSGFRAALRSAVMRRALQRNMIGPRLQPYVGEEDERDDEDSPVTSSKVSGVNRKKPKNAAKSK